MEPLRIEFGVDCPPDDAFRLWALDTSTWWPPGHSVSAEPGLTVEFEPRAGGRIFERTPAGIEHDWGEVIAWEPPRRLAFLWHLRSGRSDATDVDVTFAPAGEGDGTRVTIVHGGWERLGAAAAERRERDERGWAGVVQRYVEACSG
jgi:uncharacterized protein YndB with AHSA1/START domain